MTTADAMNEAAIAAQRKETVHFDFTLSSGENAQLRAAAIMARVTEADFMKKSIGGGHAINTHELDRALTAREKEQTPQGVSRGVQFEMTPGDIEKFTDRAKTKGLTVNELAAAYVMYLVNNPEHRQRVAGIAPRVF